MQLGLCRGCFVFVFLGGWGKEEFESEEDRVVGQKVRTAQKEKLKRLLEIVE